MIYVSQGHEKGIGIEVFLKSFLTLSANNQAKFILVVNKDSLEKNLELLGLNFNFTSKSCLINSQTLNCAFVNQKNSTQTLSSIEYILNRITPNDILLTLPSSKDQFKNENIHYSGHTEYFRKFYNQSNLTMSFLSFDSSFLLLTDHIDIKNVFKSLSPEIIEDKITNFLDSKLFEREISEIYFSGINPHCGEDGLISTDDNIIDVSAGILQKKYPEIKIHKMLAGDTLHFNIKNKNQLFVYASHDQGLGVFKLKNGLTGINYTAGLPFKRVSVDHGTAFNLWGKNQANYIGMLYLIEEILTWK